MLCSVSNYPLVSLCCFYLATLWFQVFEDAALMDTLDGEVRADVEAAARILAKRAVAGCARVVSDPPRAAFGRHNVLSSMLRGDAEFWC